MNVNNKNLDQKNSLDNKIWYKYNNIIKLRNLKPQLLIKSINFKNLLMNYY